MEDRKHVVHELAYKIVYELNQGQVLTTSALLSTIILTYRKGITPLDLVQVLIPTIFSYSFSL